MLSFQSLPGIELLFVDGFRQIMWAPALTVNNNSLFAVNYSQCVWVLYWSSNVLARWRHLLWVAFRMSASCLLITLPLGHLCDGVLFTTNWIFSTFSGNTATIKPIFLLWWTVYYYLNFFHTLWQQYDYKTDILDGELFTTICRHFKTINSVPKK